MTRIASQAVAGYFPTPRRIVELIANGLSPEPFTRMSYQDISATLFDPCIGEGEAAKILFERMKQQIVDRTLRCPGKVFVQGIELEGERAVIAAASLEGKCITSKDRASESQHSYWQGVEVHHANALKCIVSTIDSSGLSLCYLNPPYDFDRVYGRMEEAFLQRVTKWLNTSSLLLFVVPYYSLAASVDTLSRYYENVRCYRFPEPEFSVFKQVVVVAKRSFSKTTDWMIENNVKNWAEHPETIPILDETFQVTYPVSMRRCWVHELKVLKVDETTLLKQFVPFHQSGKKGGLFSNRQAYPQKNITDLLQQSYQLAASPKPAHVATAIAAGVFNGSRVVPNNPGLPPLLVKGVFDKEFRTVKENTDKKSGVVTSIVQVQQPKLTVTVFDLDNRIFRQLPQGIVINEKLRSVQDMTVADLLHYYSRDMLRVMLEQCPVNYTTDNAGEYVLPRTRRKLYAAQAHAVRALVKLYDSQLAESKSASAVLLGEIGCGKSTVSLLVAKMLKANRVIVMCPPHLLESWETQYKAVFGISNTKRLQTVQDVEDFTKMGGFALGILSREAAKLDHERGSVEKVCPSCGLPVEPNDYARKREKCSNMRSLVCEGAPLHPWTDAVVKLARCLNPFYPNDEAVKMLLPQRAYRLREHAITKTSFEDMQQNMLDHVRGNPVFEFLMVQMLEALSQIHYDTQQVFASMISRLIVHVCDDYVAFAQRVYDVKKALPQYSTTRYHDELIDTCYKRALVDGVTVPEHLKGVEEFAATHSKKSPQETLLEVLRFLVSFCKLTRGNVCGAPLYYSTPKPRRVALSQYIASHAKNAFDFLILDEGHEYSADGSAQEKAAHRLVQLGKPVLLMTGSIMNGYAHSLFTNLWYLSRKFREEFERDDVERFVDRYGYRKQIVEKVDSKTGKVVEFGTVSDRVVSRERKTGVAPGVLPLLVIKHLLPIAVTLHKEDLQLDLPPCTQERVQIEMLPEQRRAYEHLKTALMNQIVEDMFTELNGKLWGQMAELPSFLDRCVHGIGNTQTGVYEIRYPENVGGQVIASEAPLNHTLLPKEQWMITKIKEEIAEGRNVLVFGWHIELLPRLKRIIEAAIGEPVALLESRKVAPEHRESWIAEHVLAKGRKVLVLNPVGVKTGINNLVTFSTVIWYENPACNPEVMRQANGRVDRIGQTKPTRVFMPVYGDSLQDHMHQLLMAKVGVSLQTDGLNGEDALAAAGAASDDALSIGFDNIGKLLFELMQRDNAA